MAIEACRGCQLNIEVIGVIHEQDAFGIAMYRIPCLILNIRGECGLNDEFLFRYNSVVGNIVKIRDVIDKAQQDSGLVKFLQRELTYRGKCRILDHPDLKLS